MSDQQRDMNERTYRELGHYVVKFSMLIEALEMQTVHLVRPDLKDWDVVRASLGGARTLGPTSAAFFSTYHERWKQRLTVADKDIIKAIRKDVSACIEERNRVFHDIWVSTFRGGDAGPHEMGAYRTRNYVEGVSWQYKSYKPEELAAMADECERVADLVNMCGGFRPELPETAVHLRIEIDSDGKAQPKQPKPRAPK